MEVDFEIVSPLDNRYGQKDPKTGKWNGLVGMVIDGVSVKFLKKFPIFQMWKLPQIIPINVKSTITNFAHTLKKDAQKNPWDIVNKFTK